MNKSKIFLMLNLFIILASLKSTELKNDLSFRFLADFYAYPYIYDYKYNNYSDGLNGEIMLGLKYKNFSFGISVFENYFSSGINKPENAFFGSSNTVKWTFDFYYMPIEWYELQTGVGANYTNLSFVSNNQDQLFTSDFGVSLFLNSRFILPIKYLDIYLINHLDIFINSSYTNPIYYGGIRLITHPYLKWIDLYFEVGGSPYIYNSNSVKITNGLIYFGTGIQFNVILNKTIEECNEIKTKIISLNNNDDKRLKNLFEGKEGDVIGFDDILFYSDSDKIKKDSYAILNKIAEILNKRKNISIEIKGYTNAIGNPKNELELSIKRAMKVMDYLISKGIDAKRIKKAEGYGGINSKKGIIIDTNRRVEIKITKVLK